MSLHERLPQGREWVEDLRAVRPPGAEYYSTWRSGPVLVTTQLALMEAPDGSGESIWQWLVAISASGKRPKPHHVRRALRAFGMSSAEEDNHHPGVARHFFLVIDPERRVDCECKTDEQTIVDADGYAWTNPVDGPCRGCEIAPVTGKPCPIHASSQEAQPDAR